MACMEVSGLNPNATEFIPGNYVAGAVAVSLPVIESKLSEADLSDSSTDAVEQEHDMTEEDLEELETAESWVKLMAALDDMERDHMIALALTNAPVAKIKEIQMKFNQKAFRAPNRGAQRM